MKKRFVPLLVFLLIMQVAPSWAQEAQEPKKEMSAARKALIDKVLKISDIDATIAKMWKAANHRMGNDLYKLALRDASRDKSLSKEKQRAQAEDVVKRVLDNLDRRFKNEYRAEYIKIYRDIYNEFYTDEDLKKINEFYESETGKKTKEVLPGLVKSGVSDLKDQIDIKIKKCLRKRLESTTNSESTDKKI